MQNNIKKPELLSPAGDFERLRAAVDFGADAVYLGAKDFGMRAAPQNFTLSELKAAADFCHKNQKKVYLTCNIIPRNDEVERFPDFISSISGCGIDAVIVSDLGILNIVKTVAPNMEIHISTQFGVTNYESARMLYNLGAKRIVAARELSLENLAEIRAKIPKEMEIECFVHGAMCVSFSGRCLLSNYLTGRDSNRGDCAQPCRWQYSLVEESREGQYFPIEEDLNGTYIMNSKDMCMIQHIPDLCRAGVDSFKIEGRAKSFYYTAMATNAYRCAIDGYEESGFSDTYLTEKWIIEETKKISYRDYCTGFYFGDPRENANVYKEGGYIRNWDVVALVDNQAENRVCLTQRNRFFEGDEVEFITPGAPPKKLIVKDLRDENGEKIDCAPHPMMKISFFCPFEIKNGSFIRKSK